MGPCLASADTAPFWGKATGTQMEGFSFATLMGHGPQCCSSSPLSLSGWRTVQSENITRRSFIEAASAISWEMAPWMSVSHTTGMPSSLSSALAAQGMMWISS